MKFLLALPLVLLLASTIASAEPVSREATITALVRATGLEEMLEQSRQAARDQAGEMSQQMLQQVLKDAKALTPEHSDAVAAAARAFAESCAESFDVPHAIAAWGNFYAATLSDEELQQILAYYTSDIGRKDVAASKAAMPQWQAHLASRSGAQMRVAADKYVAELKRIVANAEPGATGT